MTRIVGGLRAGLACGGNLLAGAWLLALFACGGEGRGVSIVDESTGGGSAEVPVLVSGSTPNNHQESTPPPGAAKPTIGSKPSNRPRAPQTVFRDSRPVRQAWFEQMQKRVDPGPRGDKWPSEAFALWVEEQWRGFLDPSTTPQLFVSPRLQAPKSLEPKGWHALPASECVQAKQSEEFEPPVVIEHAGWTQVLRAFLSIPGELQLAEGGDQGAMVQVYRVTALADDQFQIEARIRVWSRGGRSAWCRTLESTQVWQAGKSPRMLRFQPLQVQDALSPAPLFQDLTRIVLPVSLVPAHSLYAGGTELTGRHDRLFPKSTQYLGMHGLAVGDVNGDGLEDIYVARSGGIANHLFIRQPDGTLQDGTLEAGVADLNDTSGVLICDLDGDGARDLVAGLGPLLVISWNDGRGTFSERTTLTQGPNASMVYSICAADADGDGDVDLYDTRYFEGGRQGAAPTPYQDANNGAPNSFWRNGGSREFAEATKESGLDMANRRFSLAALWEDLDADGDLDLYVTNDFGRNNLYRNDGGHFVDIAGSSDAIDMAASMGISAADVDRDGNMDLYISNMYTPAGERIVRNARFQKHADAMVRASYLGHSRGNSLLMGQGNGQFQLRGDMAGTGPSGWSWGSVFMDFDMDGLPDLVAPNGFATGKKREDLASFFWRVVVNASPLPGASDDTYLRGWQCITQTAVEDGYSWNGHERHHAYWNVGDGKFADISAVSGLDLLEDGRCAAVVDWDLDGKPDLWLAHRSAPVLRFMHNRIGSSGHWVSLELVGRAPNTEAIGALVHVRQGEKNSQARVYAGESYLGGGSKRRLFGLGSDDADVLVTITWPDGETQALDPLAVDHLYRVEQGAGTSPVTSNFQSLSQATGGKASRGRGRALQRVIPVARLPLSAWDLPDFSRQRPTIGDLGPGPVLVYVYGSWEGAGFEGLQAMAQANEFSSYSLRIVNLDGPRQAAQVQSQLSRVGLLSRSGRGGRRVRNLIDTMLGEILGAAKDRDLPIGLLFDGEGALAAIYMDGMPLKQIERDALALRKQAAGENPTGLSGGRWFGPKPKRSILPMAAFLRRAGEIKLAESLEAWVADQGPGVRGK
ncbi:MAG: CRTAC1 family protein [bacterium]|nr:CRTAC1 family protein [bacterium]